MNNEGWQPIDTMPEGVKVEVKHIPCDQPPGFTPGYWRPIPE